jgi:hypothetical protein
MATGWRLPMWPTSSYMYQQMPEQSGGVCSGI